MRHLHFFLASLFILLLSCNSNSNEYNDRLSGTWEINIVEPNESNITDPKELLVIATLKEVNPKSMTFSFEDQHGNLVIRNNKNEILDSISINIDGNKLCQETKTNCATMEFTDDKLTLTFNKYTYHLTRKE